MLILYVALLLFLFLVCSSLKRFYGFRKFIVVTHTDMHIQFIPATQRQICARMYVHTIFGEISNARAYEFSITKENACSSSRRKEKES